MKNDIALILIGICDIIAGLIGEHLITSNDIESDEDDELLSDVYFPEYY